MRDFVLRYQRELHRGLLGEPSSLRMLPTYHTISPPKGEKSVLALDMGGTHLRAAQVRLNEGKPLLSNRMQCPTPGRNRPMEAEEFFSFWASLIASYPETEVGLCFSFPAEILPNRDAKLLFFNKNIDISGCEGKILGEEISRRLPTPKSISVLNDTTAVLLGGLLSHPTDCAVGLVVGTGLNLCCPIDGMLYNTESGGFDGFPREPFDLVLDAVSSDPGIHPAGKMIGGEYLSEVCRRASGLDIPPFSMAELTAFLQGSGPLWERLSLADERNCLTHWANWCIHRAASYTAVMVAGAFLELPSGKATVFADGSTFYKAPGFQTQFEETLRSLTPRPFRIVPTQDATLLGTAAACLTAHP